MAQHVDDRMRENHPLDSLIGDTQQMADLYQALADGNLDAIPEEELSVEPAGAKPYESQYEALYQECFAYVEKNLTRGPCTREEVWNVARQWATERPGSITEQLRRQLEIE